MASLNALSIFAALCLLGMIAVATGALLEIARQKRGESLLRPGQFRLRIFSALVWMITLGSLAYAVAFLWPHKGDVAGARTFLSVVSGALALLLIGLFLLGYDWWQLARQRRLHEKNFTRTLAEAARAEAASLEAAQEKARREKDTSL